MSRKMKDSGIEWIGKIPEGWEVRKIKYLQDNNCKDAFVDGDWIESPYIEDDGIRYLTTGNIGDGVFKEQGAGYISFATFRQLNCKYAYPNDLIISRLNAPYGRSCLLNSEHDKYVIAVDNVILRPTANKKFICFVTQCMGYQKAVEDKASGTTMKRISRINLGNVFIPLASKKEQQHITNYLDKKCSEIDSLAADIQKQIGILEQYRKSVITETVTKGLDPNVKMKDSGIDWIGEIPEEWEIKRIKYMFNVVSGSTPKSDNFDYWDGDVIWITPADYKTLDKHIENGNRKISKLGLLSCSTTLVPKESIIFSKRAPIGTVAIAAVNLCTNQGCLSCIPQQEVYSLFYYYVMSIATEDFELKGSGTTFKEISTTAFNDSQLPFPPFSVQQQIASYLDSKSSKIDELIRLKNQQLETLAQYKKSLIYEYVTGKKEVI